MHTLPGPTQHVTPHLGWLGIMRLGLVQASLGAVVVLATGTLNRIMIVEIGLPAMVPGMLVAWHYLIQILRPRLGHGSDRGGRRTPWILGGVALLGLGAVGAAMATTVMQAHPIVGLLLALIDYSFIGIGVGCAGTSLLVLLAQRTQPERRPAAATVVWIMMIAGFVVTTILAGQALEPYSPERLVRVVTVVAALALLISTLAVWRVERRASWAEMDTSAASIESASIESAPIQSRAALSSGAYSSGAQSHDSSRPQSSFLAALREVWQERTARNFATFVFVAMLAYSAQELLLDPFAGAVYGYTPGASTQLSGVQHGGALLGMILVALSASRRNGRALATPRLGTLSGCIASALMLALVAVAAIAHLHWSLRPMIFLLGVANGCFAVSAIASMMQMVGQGSRRREGVRMGVWGAAQALAFAFGGLGATGLLDLSRMVWTDPGHAYGAVFCVQAGLFLFAAHLAHRLWGVSQPAPQPSQRAESGLVTS